MDGVRRNARAHGYFRPLVFFASLLVRSCVEGDEQDQIRAQSRATREGGELLTPARSDMGK